MEMDSKTQVYVDTGTRHGLWLPIPDVVRALQDKQPWKVAQYVSSTGIVSFATPEAPYREMYAGHMVRLTHDYLDLCVTDKQRLFLCRDFADRQGKPREVYGGIFYDSATVGRTSIPAKWMLSIVEHGQVNMRERETHSFVTFPVVGGNHLGMPTPVPCNDVEATRVEWAGALYGLSVPSENLVVRRNDKVCVL
jgi:hypothetical protein